MMIKQSIFGHYHVMTLLFRSQDIAEAIAWCKANVATKESDEERCLSGYSRMWTYEPFITTTNFVFDREKDAFAFALKFA